MVIGVVRRVSMLVLCIVAGVVGVLMMSFPFTPDNLLSAGQILIESVAPNATISLPEDADVSLSWTGSMLLFVVGLAHLLVAAIAIWPWESTRLMRGAITINEEGMSVRISYAVIGEYVLRVMKKVEGIKRGRAYVESGDEGVRVYVKAEFDAEEGTVPELSRKLREVLRKQIDMTFGQDAIQDVTVNVSRVLPPQTEGRTVMSRERAKKEETPAEEATETAAAPEPQAETSVIHDDDQKASVPEDDPFSYLPVDRQDNDKDEGDETEKQQKDRA